MLIPFHVVTGCYHPSGFNRYGKKSMFENLQKDHGVQHLLQKVGEYLELSDDGGMIWGGLCFWKYMGKGIYLLRSKSWKMEKNEEEKLCPSSCWWRHFASSFGSSKLFILPPKALRTESSSFSQRTWLGTQKRKMLSCLICSSSNADVLRPQLQVLSDDDDGRMGNMEIIETGNTVTPTPNDTQHLSN